MRFLAELGVAVIKFPIDFFLDRSGIKNVDGGGEAAKGFLDTVVSSAQIGVNNLIRKSVRRNKISCIIVDEANKALPGLMDMDGSPEAKSAPTAITKWTKQTDEASVILISSEFGYPFRLMANGLDQLPSRTTLSLGRCPGLT